MRKTMTEGDRWREIAWLCEADEGRYGWYFGLCYRIDHPNNRCGLSRTMHDRLALFQPAKRTTHVHWWTHEEQGARILAACLLAVWADEGEAI